MSTLRLSIAIVALASSLQPASADQPVRLRYAGEGQAPASSDIRAAPPSEPAPSGIPGFYDPATRKFSPLPSGERGDEVFSGTATVAIHISARGGIGPDDTVFCTLTVYFGNVAGKPAEYFTNHMVRAGTNFAAGEPSIDLAAPFSYAPNGNGDPKMRIQVDCRVPNASDGTAHSATRIYPVQDLANGAVTKSVDMQL